MFINVQALSERLGAPVVISDADVKRTFLELLSPDVVPVALRRKVRRPTSS